jgi:hypothetical protein
MANDQGTDLLRGHCPMAVGIIVGTGLSLSPTAAQGTTESVPSVFCGQNWIVIVHQWIARRDGSS